MKLTSCILFLMILIFADSQAQEEAKLNSTDKNGRKQGHWIRRDQNGHIQYDGVFKDDHPVGTFKRFYENDTLQSVLQFSDDGKEADAIFFHPNGFVASHGKYINQFKEGMWSFYSSKLKGYLISEEMYKKNLKNGLSERYYPDGSIFERLTFTSDVKTGEWTQYYPGGQVCIRAYYAGGILQGKFEVFYEDGKLQFAGQYKNDARDGTWLRYNNDGTLKTKINYIDGLATNPDKYREETEYLDKIEKNKGKITDPEKTGTIWN